MWRSTDRELIKVLRLTQLCVQKYNSVSWSNMFFCDTRYHGMTHYSESNKTIIRPILGALQQTSLAVKNKAATVSHCMSGSPDIDCDLRIMTPGSKQPHDVNKFFLIPFLWFVTQIQSQPTTVEHEILTWPVILPKLQYSLGSTRWSSRWDPVQ